MKTTFACMAFLTCALFAPGIEPSSLAPLPNYDHRAGTPALPDRERATAALHARMREVRVDRDPVTQSPKWISSTARFLTGPGGEGGAVQAATAAAIPQADPHRAVKAFLNEHRSIFGHDATALDAAKIAREDVSPTGLHTVVWQQYVDEIPVFEGLLKAGLTPRGELVNIGSQFVAAPAAAALAGTPRGAPQITVQRAVALAAHEAGAEVREETVAAKTNADGAILHQDFTAPGLNAANAQLTWLPMDANTLRLCWRVILTNRARGEMFLVLIDAQTGAAHVRHGLTEYISDASYRVFTSDSPTPMSPGLATPGSTQPALVPRLLVTTPALDAVASPNGWIDDGVNETRGNNVDAHTDTNGDNLPDLPRPQGSPFRVFDFALDLTQDPSTYHDAAVTNLFYWCNLVHDRYYELGFTEAAGNFQNDNFGRGGVGNDAIQADAQNFPGTNNANFSCPPDGQPGRVQMLNWTGPSPHRDSDLDAQVMVHEFTHGLSGRLVGGGVGISATQTRGMGEGWSDFYSLCVLSKAGDDVDGNYPQGAYVTYHFSPGYEQNYFFGFRRYPYSTDPTKNPLTFKDIDPTQASPHAGIPLNPIDSASNATPSEVHAQGEVWCNTLWQARANLIKKFGFPAGNDLILQIVTDGMKLAPANPTFLQARDAIIQADQAASNGANRNELWAAFSKRGMGARATAPDSSTTTGVLENYDPPDDLNVAPFAPFAVSGDLGGPFAPATQTYTVANYGTSALSWTAVAPQPWLTLSATSGTLAPGDSIDVIVTINASAAALEIGTYTQTITFQDVQSGVILPREVDLTVQPQRAYYFPLDSDPGWAREGEWAFGHPTGGGGANPIFYHDPANGATGANVFGANLAGDISGVAGGPYYLTTTALDCSGLSYVQLDFQRWLNADPLAPSVIEISNDGVTWVQVWNSGTVEISDRAWQKEQYDISAVADFQSSVFIRWGYQTINDAITTSGWNIDDIEILGASDNLIVTVPPFASEGDAPTTGTVTASPAPAADLLIHLTVSDPTRLSVPATVTIAAGTTSATFPVAVFDDALLNGSEPITVRPSAPTWAGNSGTIVVNDNETAVLGVSLPATVTKGVGSVTGAVTVSAPPDRDVVVSLISSAPDAAAVPAMVTIPAGQTSVSFALAVTDDGRIDGSRNVTVSASVANWTPGIAAVTVLDHTGFSLTVPTASARITEGDANTWSGTVAIFVTLGADLIVTLSSDDTTEITVPATVTIPAGQTSAKFQITVVDDTETDGTQIAHITASAPGFTPASAAVPVYDNDVAYYVIAPIAGPLVRGVPIVVSVTAKDVNGVTLLKNYTGINSFGHFSVTATATGDSGPIPIATLEGNAFQQGVWTPKFTANAFATNVVVTISDGNGHTGASNPFDVVTGPVNHFAWDAIASAQTAGTPFLATVRAFDAGGNPVTSFAGTVNLSAASVTARPPTGTGTAATFAPFSAQNTAARLQTIYPAGALGGAGRLSSLAFNVNKVVFASSTYKNWTIRLQHTTLSNLNTGWVNSGWTVVHLSDASIPNPGWVTFPFQTGFDYDGTSNLLVDFSYGNPTTFFALGVSCLGTSVSGFLGPVRNASSTTIGIDPLTLDSISPNQSQSNVALNLQFSTASALAMLPAATTPFVNGVWTGNVSLAASGATMSIRADDSSGHFGVSGTFTVNPADADGDGLPDAWAAQYGVHGALAVPDGDGLSNLMEYALGLNPTTTDVLPAAQLVTDPGDGLTYLTWQYRQRLDSLLLSYIVEASDDLVTWHSDAAWVQQVGAPTPNGDGLTETVTVRALPAITGAAQRYLRLRVTMP